MVGVVADRPPRRAERTDSQVVGRGAIQTGQDDRGAGHDVPVDPPGRRRAAIGDQVLRRARAGGEAHLQRRAARRGGAQPGRRQHGEPAAPQGVPRRACAPRRRRPGHVQRPHLHVVPAVGPQAGDLCGGPGGGHHPGAGHRRARRHPGLVGRRTGDGSPVQPARCANGWSGPGRTASPPRREQPWPPGRPRARRPARRGGPAAGRACGARAGPADHGGFPHADQCRTSACGPARPPTERTAPTVLALGLIEC